MEKFVKKLTLLSFLAIVMLFAGSIQLVNAASQTTEVSANQETEYIEEAQLIEIDGDALLNEIGDETLLNEEAQELIYESIMPMAIPLTRDVIFNPERGTWPAAPGVSVSPNRMTRAINQSATTYAGAMHTNNIDILAHPTILGSPARPAPTRTGYIFAGWFTEGGMRVNHSTTVTPGFTNINLYAQWTPLTREVRFYPQGGSWPAAPGVSVSPNRMTRAINQSATTYAGAMHTNNMDILAHPTILGSPARPAPTRQGYAFAGWFTAESGGTRVNRNTTVTPGSTTITLHAQWTPLVRSIFFDPQGGTWAAAAGRPVSINRMRRIINQSATTYAAAIDANNIDILPNPSNPAIYPARPAPTRQGYEFAGWFTARNGGTRVNHNTTVTPGFSDITLYARWTPSTRYIFFNPQGGTWAAAGGRPVSTNTMRRIINQSATTYAAAINANNIDILANPSNPIGYPARPAPTRQGYEFAGWFTARNGGTRVNHNTTVTPGTTDITLYAQWFPTTLITWNANGGSVTPGSQHRIAWDQIRTLPTPTPPPTPPEYEGRRFIRFIGWFTTPNITGGTRITPYTIVPTSNVTYHARWSDPARHLNAWTPRDTDPITFSLLGINEPWRSPMMRGMNNWNNSNVPVTFQETPFSNNLVEITSSDENFFGRIRWSSSGQRMTEFKIYMNSRTIAGRVNYKESVFSHELGHALGLRDNPPVSNRNDSLMNTLERSRDRNIVRGPTPFDIQSVNILYH